MLGFEDVAADDTLGYQTPLQWAADGGFAKICSMLIDGGADPDSCGAHPDEFRPIHLAALNGNADVVQAKLPHARLPNPAADLRQSAKPDPATLPPEIVLGASWLTLALSV